MKIKKFVYMTIFSWFITVLVAKLVYFSDTDSIVNTSFILKSLILSSCISFVMLWATKNKIENLFLEIFADLLIVNVVVFVLGGFILQMFSFRLDIIKMILFMTTVIYVCTYVTVISINKIDAIRITKKIIQLNTKKGDDKNE